VVLPSSARYGILKMSAICSEALVTTYQITQFHKVQDYTIYWHVAVKALHGMGI
jgi:hypothetical protein